MDKIKEFLEQLEMKSDEEVKEILKLNDDIWSRRNNKRYN